MEKIQIAIAKARAERDRQNANAETVGESPERGAQPSPASPTPHQPTADTASYSLPAVSPDIVAAWQELASFSPNADHMARHRIVSYESGGGSTTSDILRTKVLQQMRANGWRRLAITSPTSGCGKSTVAMNLAFSMSRQSDLRTIVCDMDLRHPSLANILGTKGERSLARVLTGETNFRAEAIRARPNLAFGLNDSRVRNSAELLQSPMVGPALAELTKNYAPDLTIFDLPPMFSSDDTMAFLGHVDCVILVAAAGKTTVKEIDICEAEMAQQTNILGVVLNKCRYMDKNNI